MIATYSYLEIELTQLLMTVPKIVMIVKAIRTTLLHPYSAYIRRANIAVNPIRIRINSATINAVLDLPKTTPSVTGRKI